MSKKDKKIKQLKKEVKELRAALLKLKSHRRTKASKSQPKSRTKSQPKSQPRSEATSQPVPKPPAPARTDIDTPAEMAAALKSISAARAAG